MDSVFDTVFATTTAQIQHQVSTNIPYLWVFMIALGAILLVASVIVGIFWHGSALGSRVGAPSRSSWMAHKKGYLE